MEGSGNGVSISMGALWGEPGGRAPLLGTLKDMLSKVLETSVFFPPIGVQFRGTWAFPRDFERRVRFFHHEDFYWGIRETRERRLGKRATPSIGAPLEGVSFIGRSWVTNEGGVWKRSISLCGSSVRGTGRGGYFTGDPEVKEGYGNRHLSQ